MQCIWFSVLWLIKFIVLIVEIQAMCDPYILLLLPGGEPVRNVRDGAGFPPQEVSSRHGQNGRLFDRGGYQVGPQGGLDCGTHA